MQVKRTLRIFVSNTAKDQPWQLEMAAAENVAGGGSAPDVDAASARQGGPSGPGGLLDKGDGIASWVLRVEGRVLDVSVQPEPADNSLATIG